MKSNEIAKKRVVYDQFKYKYVKFVCAWVLFAYDVFAFWYLHRFTCSIVDLQHHWGNVT